MICLCCAELKAVRRGARCPACGTDLVDETSQNLELLVGAKLKARVRAWGADGTLDAQTADRLDQTLPDVRPPWSKKPAVARAADALADRLPESEDLRPGWLAAVEHAFRERDDWQRRPPPEHDVTSDAAAGAGGAMFGGRSTATLTGGLHSLAELDEGDASLKSVFGDYVWWFIGTLLVLAGSVMGVREAWLALGGVPRLLVVAGALLAYHGGFVALSAVVAKKSGAAGRVLGGIALSLLPVVFAALSALVALSLPAGALAAAVALAATTLTLRTLSRRFEGDAVSLAIAFLPALAAELPLSLPGLTFEVRLALPLVAVAACAVAARKSFAALLLALYGLVALAVFTVVGAPGFDAVPLDFGTFGYIAMTGWAAAVALAVAPPLATPEARTAFPHAAPAAEVIALSVAAAAGVAAFAGALAVTVGVDRRADTFAAVVPIIAAAAFAVVRAERRHAVHPAIVLAVLASVLVARLEWSGSTAGWLLGPAAVAALLFVAARFTEKTNDAVLLCLWGALVGVGSLVGARLLDVAPMKATWLAAALVAAGAHGAGGWKLWGLHYIGGIAVLFGLEAFVTTPGTFPLVLGATALGYLVAGRAWRLPSFARDRRALPFDDVSLAATVGAGVLAFGAAIAAPPDVPLLTWETIGAAVIALSARAFVDKTRVLSSAAAALIGAGVAAFTWQRTGLGGAALALAGVALLRGRADDARVRGRKVLDVFPLPFGASGRLLWGDGFATAALVFVALSVLRTVAFLGNIVEPDRPAAVLGAALTLGVALVAFFTRAFSSYGMRGHVATWAAAGLLVVLAALANRLGRPLPPQVVGFRFSLIVPALWVFAVAVRRFGPRVAKWLENEAQGPHYHWVPHAGVAALGLLCLVEAPLIGGADPVRFLCTVPPLLVLAGGLAALLLGRSFTAPWLTSTALGIFIVAAALAGAQQAVLGPELVQLNGQGAWLLTTALPPADLVFDRAVRGVAIIAAVYAALAVVTALPTPRVLLARWAFGSQALPLQPVLTTLLSGWAERAAFAVFAAALLQPRFVSAALVVATALLLRGAGEKQPAGRVALFGIAAVHAALAVATGAVPLWAGPSLAAAGLVVMVVRALRAGADEGVLLRAHVAATCLGVSGLTWALATGAGPVDPGFALPSVLGAAAGGLWRWWPVSFALPVTLGLIAATQGFAASRWPTALRRWTFAGTAVDVALAAAALTAVVLERRFAVTDLGGSVWPDLVRLEGGPLSLALCGGIVVAHLGATVTKDDTAAGLSLGRDWAFGLLGLCLALFVGFGARSQLGLSTGAAALAGAFIVSVLAAIKHKTGRHAWAAQVAVVGGYALVQSQWVDLEPALDAVLGLVFAFTLVGVTVLARRAGVAPVAKATRAFAALLPIVVALAFPTASNRDTAALAAASSVLYAVLATVEHNRFFGALAAFSANLALLILALSQGLNGPEIFLAPLGLLALMLAQLFKKTLPHGARTAVRIIGGVLLYAPAAVKLSFQLGDAADASYAVVFGGVCLLGVAAGMVLQIRAYLAMGTLFLTLDVVANLVNAGLRDYRIGFVVLSVTGLMVLASMVFATLKRDLVREWVGRLRRRLRGWD